jgi:hypothetical protein
VLGLQENQHWELAEQTDVDDGCVLTVVGSRETTERVGRKESVASKGGSTERVKKNKKRVCTTTYERHHTMYKLIV